MSQRFIAFKSNVLDIELPKKFTFPFDYVPHKLALIASQELQDYLKTQNEWQHDFDSEIGKMFGVLVVRNQENQLGYLAAFSGILANKTILPHFVPPVFDRQQTNSFYKELEDELNQLNSETEALEKSGNYLRALDELAEVTSLSEKELSNLKAEIKSQKKIRKAKREENLTDQELEQLRKESMDLDFGYKRAAKHWKQKTEKSQAQVLEYNSEIEKLKKERKSKSAAMQKALFIEYELLNKEGVKQNVVDIFEPLKRLPPAGTGDCAAPKLLQYAFQQNYTPITMAEFWWGKSPKLEVRKHAHFYPACKTKCEPILSHMLSGLKLDENPILDLDFDKLKIEIIFEDEFILVINKPAGLLSVPGKRLKDSVETRLKSKYHEATGPMLAHRLDMGTSGLMVISKSLETHRLLQSQFTKRTVKKRYLAVLNGVVEADSGSIELPLRVDIENRPTQVVDFQYGKKAVTKWEVIERKNNQTRVYFYPITGRTHQLRVHASHPQGLNASILGDELYGVRKNRLHLQAIFIEFVHPVKKTSISFELEPEF